MILLVDWIQKQTITYIIFLALLSLTQNQGQNLRARIVHMCWCQPSFRAGPNTKRKNSKPEKINSTFLVRLRVLRPQSRASGALVLITKCPLGGGGSGLPDQVAVPQRQQRLSACYRLVLCISCKSTYYRRPSHRFIIGVSSSPSALSYSMYHVNHHIDQPHRSIVDVSSSPSSLSFTRK